MHAFSKVIADFRTLHLKCDGLTHDELVRVADYLSGSDKRTLRVILKAHSTLFNTLKIIPESVPPQYVPKIIASAPIECVEGDNTYRIVTDDVSMPIISLIAREDEPLYDYLDAGFYLLDIEDDASYTSTFIASNSYDVHTAYVFMLCKLQPSLVKFLTKECFINKYDAELLKLKMIKNLTTENKDKYKELAECIDRDYKKNTTLVVISKIINSDIEGTMLQNIQFYKHRVAYDNVIIEADNLLELLHTNLNFDGEFDIYTICNVVARNIESQLDTMTTPLDGKVYTAEIKINGIPIKAALNDNGQRFVNDIRINKSEVATVIYRASCYHSSEEYRLFVKATSNLSLKMHDVIANGLALKIHHSMTGAEYRNPEPSLDAPRLKFFVDKEGDYKLEVSSERSVKVHLGRLVKRAEAVNKKTDNQYFYSTRANGYRSGYRNYLWGAEQIIKALLECCTFKEEESNASGFKTVTQKCLITEDDLCALLDVAKTEKLSAIERSKEFMATAVAMTGAELIEFKGKRAYKVTGSLRTYAIVIENAKVYDFDTKQYRCIVNDRHYDGAGYDDVATRLLTLKNDSVLQSSVSTLRGAAQPQYENEHAHTPEREADGLVAGIVASLANKTNA
jgi:hypothetical protein